MRLHSAALGAAAAVGLAACAQTHLDVTARLSPPPRPGFKEALRAGFARADITPPPGVGLAGEGPESARARGYRLRLYARVLVLADSAGNRIAIVVADLPLGSAVLHRRVAEQTASTDGIGVDRLVIAVTHTHAGPGHYFDAGAYNDQSSSVVGYDPLMVDSLTARIARAVHAAARDLRPARVAWGSTKVWGYTRIRNLPPMTRNVPLPLAPSEAPAELLPEYRLVDPELSMLRVDQRDERSGKYLPGGAFSIFAMHGTGNAPANDLLDADIHGIVERRLERHIDSVNHHMEMPFVPRAFYLFANGTEGDVSPAWPPQSRCAVPQLVTFPALDGPFTRGLWKWRPPTQSHIAWCEHAAREAVEWIGGALGDSAARLFDGLKESLTDSMTLARAFVTLALRDDARALGICPEPAVGMSALAGVADAHTRVEGWRLLGVLPVGLEEGAANPDPRGCQAQKRAFFDVIFRDWFNSRFVTKQLPSYAEVSVLQLGDRLIATLPGEVTTTAGRRMRDAMLVAARDRSPAVKAALIMGLTNGYLEYVTTPEEYTAQYYEGGSTLYGPAEAAMFGRTLAELAARVSKGDSLPSSQARTMALVLGHQRNVVPRPKAGALPQTKIDRAWCSGDTLYTYLEMGRDGDWPVSTGDFASRPRVEVVAVGDAESVVSWDDDPKLELRLRGQHHGVASWELRWSGARRGTYRVRATQDAKSGLVTCSPVPQ